jgi:hypothetical protein
VVARLCNEGQGSGVPRPAFADVRSPITQARSVTLPGRVDHEQIAESVAADRADRDAAGGGQGRRDDGWRAPHPFDQASVSDPQAKAFAC